MAAERIPATQPDTNNILQFPQPQAIERVPVRPRISRITSGVWRFAQSHRDGIAFGTTMLVAAGLMADCGGDGKAAPSTTDIPRNTVAADTSPTVTPTQQIIRFEITPTATPTAAEVRPTATPTPKIDAASKYTPDAQQLISNLDNIKVLNQEQKDAVKTSFSRDWDLVANETSDIKKIAPYMGLYSSLRSNWNVTKDNQVRELMNQTEALIRVRFPRIYPSLAESGAFLKPDVK